MLVDERTEVIWLFHSFGEARSAVDRCALELVNRIENWKVIADDLKPGRLSRCLEGDDLRTEQGAKRAKREVVRSLFAYADGVLLQGFPR